MAGEAPVQVAFGGDEGLLGGADPVVAGERRLDPVLLVARLGIDDGQAGVEAVDFLIGPAGERAQAFEEDALVARRLDAVHHGVVELGLRVEHVGDRDEADVETLLHLLELSPDGFLGGLRGLQGGLAAQHVEIRIRNAGDELLGCRREVPLGLLGGGAGAQIAVPARHVDHRLADVGPPAAPRHVAFGKRLAELVQAVHDDRGLGRAGICADARQQHGPGLRDHFAPRLAAGAGRRQNRIVLQGGGVHVAQIGRVGARGEACAGGHGGRARGAADRFRHGETNGALHGESSLNILSGLVARAGGESTK